MPITTLPNPGMDFTPLTPLTAEEMDNIVENIEAINNATIQTGSIADGAITKAKLGADAMSNQNYSTTEIDTGTTWIDGKKIYKKTIDCGAPPATGQTKNIDINVANFEKAIKIEGIMFDNSNEAFPLPFIDSSFSNTNGNYEVEVYQIQGSGTWQIWVSRGNANADLGITKVYVTLYYTKTS